MINRFINASTLALLFGLFMTAPSAWAMDNTSKEETLSSNTLKQAIALKKSGQINLAIKALNKHLQGKPHDLLGKVELAANYFLANDYARGGKLFKKILSDSQTPNKVKKNISRFISHHKKDIKKYASLNKQLYKIKRSSQITTIKTNQTQALLVKDSGFKKAQLYLASLYLKQYRGREAKQLLKSIIYPRLTPEEENAFSKLSNYYQKRYQPSSNIIIKGSFILGYDSNITAGGDSDLPGDLGAEENGGEPEEEFEAEFNEEFEAEFNEEFEAEFNEEFEGEFEEEFEEAYEEAYEEAHEKENNTEEKSGVFNRLNARIQMNHSTPVISDGRLTHSIESTFFANVTEREYQDNEAQHRNYRVMELGASIARRSNRNNRFALPISIKKIQLNGENYAHFYEGSLSYGFNINQNRISFSEKISYRDYQHFNEERENALLVKTSVSINRALNPSFSVSGKMAFTLLNTDNTPHTSYDRFKVSLGITYQASNAISLGVGNEYQITNYNDYFKPEALEDCVEADLCYEENREDRYSNYYLDSRFTLNKNWSIKGRLSKSQRKTNHDKHEYSRTTFSAGIYVKF